MRLLDLKGTFKPDTLDPRTDLFCETHEGRISFLRQQGSYPIIVGVKERLPLGARYDVRITGHMLRSLTGEVVRGAGARC